MSLKEFWKSSLYEIKLRIRGKSELIAIIDRPFWERTRWLTWHMWNLNVAKEYRLDSPADLLPFDWDGPEMKTTKAPKPKIEVLSDEEKKRRFEKTDRYMKKKYGRKEGT